MITAARKAISPLIDRVFKKEDIAATVLKKGIGAGAAMAFRNMGVAGTMGAAGAAIVTGVAAYKGIKCLADCMHNRPKTAFNAASFMTGTAAMAAPPPVNAVLLGTAGMLGLLGYFSYSDNDVQRRNEARETFEQLQRS